MKLLKRSEIDEAKWEDCLSNSTQPLVYGKVLVLDHLCEQWEAVVEMDEFSNYCFVFPLPIKVKYGISYIYPPFFIQQLGPFHLEGYDYDFIELEEILFKRSKFCEIYLNRSFNGTKHLCNNILNLRGGYEKLVAGYSKNHIRNLKKSKSVVLQEGTDVELILKLFKSDDKPEVSYTAKDYQNFNALTNALEKVGNSFTVGGYLKGKLITAAVFWEYKNRLVFIFSGNSAPGKSNAGLFAIIDYVIKKYAGKDVILDFEGSSNEGVNRFYQGFGSKQEEYSFYRYNRLPFPLNFLKKK